MYVCMYICMYVFRYVKYVCLCVCMYFLLLIKHAPSPGIDTTYCNVTSYRYFAIGKRMQCLPLL